MKSACDHSAAIAAGSDQQPVVFGASCTRMQATPGYARASDADCVSFFHGREVRQVEGAAGGMGMAMHLSDTEDDPEGWSPQELADYNGWGHDSGRPWRCDCFPDFLSIFDSFRVMSGLNLMHRNVESWASEGVSGTQERFGEAAFGLHHRLYLHLDRQNNFWLSAEDGCEGFAYDAGAKAAGRRGLF